MARKVSEYDVRQAAQRFFDALPAGNWELQHNGSAWYAQGEMLGFSQQFIAPMGNAAAWDYFVDLARVVRLTKGA